jgi:hypothetical protein
MFGRLLLQHDGRRGHDHADDGAVAHEGPVLTIYC